MSSQQPMRFLFIINSSAGKKTTDWKIIITNFFSTLPHEVHMLDLPQHCSMETLTSKINAIQPDRVISVGGDGTAKLVAECILHSSIVLGILPAGSANGM